MRTTQVGVLLKAKEKQIYIKASRILFYTCYGKVRVLFSARQLSFQSASRTVQAFMILSSDACFSTQRFRVRTGGYALIFYKHCKAEGSPYPFLSTLWDFPLLRLCKTFFERYLMSPKGPPSFFDILQQNVCWKTSKSPPFTVFEGKYSKLEI